MARSIIQRRGVFDTETIVPLATYPAGVLEKKMLIQGNSVLSTVTVVSLDPGATVLVEWFEVTTGNIKDEGQFIDLESHPLISASNLTAPSKITITRIHEQPRCRVTITGGTARLEVHTTVVDSFASDLDAALVFHEQAVNLLKDKGIPVAAYDSANEQFVFLPIKDGVVQVGGEVEAGSLLINKRFYNESLALAHLATASHITYTVPANKTFLLLSAFGTGDTNGFWRMQIDGATYQSKRNAYDHPNVELDLQNPVELIAGQLVEIKVTNNSVCEGSGHFETFLYGKESDV